MDWSTRTGEEVPEGLDVERTIDEFFIDSAPTMLTALTLVFVFAAVVDVLLFPLDVAVLLISLLLATAAALGGLRALLGAGDLDPAWARPMAALLAVAGLSNGALPVLLTGDPLQAVWLILLLIASGVVILDTWVLTGLYAGTIGLWSLVIFAHSPDVAWWIMLHAVLIGILLSVAVHTMRRGELTHIAILRHRDRERTTRLEQEIRDRRATEADLRRSRGRLRAILRNLPVILFTVDDEERVTFVGGQALEALPIDREALVGERLSDLAERTLPIDLDAAIDNTRRALRGESVVAEAEVDGRIYEARYEPLAGEEIVALVMDVTERREAQRRDMELRRLEEVNRFKTDLLNSVSHELKTPLTPIRMQIHRLKGEKLGPVTDEQIGSLEVIDRNIQRLARLVEDVLEVARGERAQLRLEIEQVEVDEVVHEMVDAFRMQAEEEQIDLRAGDVADGTVPADRDRLVQVLANLVSNAIKYTSEDGGTVTIAAEAGADEVRFTISDTGIGIAEDQVEEIFEPFSRVHDDAQPGEGSGLGLYISRQIVEAHGGRIDVESPGPGEGTTFTVVLPRDVNGSTSRTGAPGSST